MSESTHVQKGLEGVIADTTAVSLVDGEAGRLYYRGYPVESLTSKRFAEVMHLVVFGELPDAERLDEVEEYLWVAGRLPPEVAASLRQIARHGEHPMATLQSIASLLAIEPPAISLGRSQQEEEALIVAARLPAAIATINAALQDHPEHRYPASRHYGERYLQLLHGRRPTPTEVSVFESTQILQLDHGFNASTFTARVVTSTLAPATSALSAAMGALYGPLHGAADQQALEMALEVGEPERARDFVAHCLATGRKVMGMGHREYRVVDPRSRMIRTLAQQVAREPAHVKLLDVLSAVDEAFIEQTREKRRTLRANLEFYKGVVYLALGIPKEFFTASFAAARVFGWIAHVMEQRQDNRIIRPAAHYVGPAPRESA
ncbi:MAG TPA: citrate/2-methylcitrate synthase [Steroidobacter sp.]|uniref:citrate/2-methylcitrate synthase n=1 Tax=Steroidobacter sp. TaxID=1978227 RepID=UPI002EDAD943